MGRDPEPNPEPIQVTSLVFLQAAAADVEDAMCRHRLTDDKDLRAARDAAGGCDYSCQRDMAPRL